MNYNILYVADENTERAKSQGYDISIKAWKKWGDGIPVENQEKYAQYNHKAPQFRKYDILKSLEQYDGTLVVDADTIPHPKLDRNFLEINGADLGLLAAVNNYGSMEWVNRTLENNSSLFPDIAAQYSTDLYINTGIMFFPSCNKTIELLKKFNEWIANNEEEVIRHTNSYGMGIDQSIFNLFLAHDYPDLKHELKLLDYRYNVQDLNRRQCLLNDSMFWLDMGLIFHFNCGIKPAPRALMEQTYHALWETNRCKV